MWSTLGKSERLPLAVMVAETLEQPPTLQLQAVRVNHTQSWTLDNAVSNRLLSCQTPAVSISDLNRALPGHLYAIPGFLISKKLFLLFKNNPIPFI